MTLKEEVYFIIQGGWTDWSRTVIIRWVWEEPVENVFHANTIIVRVCQTLRPPSRSPVAQGSTPINDNKVS